MRDLCVFARQNVAKDPPFSKMDLISCRNVLIYLGRPLQKRIIPMFHYALEAARRSAAGRLGDDRRLLRLFEVADKNHRIFMKRQTGQRRSGSISSPATFVPSGAARARARSARRRRRSRSPDLQKEADRLVLARIGPPGVIINDDFEVVQFRGATSPYLEPAPGKASLNLLKMVAGGASAGGPKRRAEGQAHGEAVRKKAVPTKQTQGFQMSIST